MTWLGMWEWKPNGFQSPSNEAIMVAAENRSIYNRIMHYTYHAAFHVRGDESTGNWFGYIPTEQQVVALQAIAQMHYFGTVGYPTQTSENTPAGRALTQSLYQQADQLWRQLASAADQGF